MPSCLHTLKASSSSICTIANTFSHQSVVFVVTIAIMLFHTLRTFCLLGVALTLGTLANPTSVSVKHSSQVPAAGVASGKAKAVSQSLGPAAAAAAAAAPSLVGEPGQTVMICDPGTTKNCAIETPKLGVKPICHTLKQYTSETGMGGFIVSVIPFLPFMMFVSHARFRVCGVGL